MNRAALFAPLFAIPLLAVFFAFSLGWNGPIILDDNLHLPKLAGYDDTIDSRAEFAQLVFGGERLVGRQLSYLSLLVDDNRWPTETARFKRTNTLLHMLNGVLVLLFVRSLMLTLRGRLSVSAQQADWIALAAMAMWVVHPLHLSPTMMIIQRMTLLAGTFSLLAMICYLHGRRLAVKNTWAGYAWMTFGFGACMTLGVFSKEPAILTALYLLVIEFTLLSRFGPTRPPHWRTWAGVMLVLPLALVVLNYLRLAGYMDELYIKRDYNMMERLLTEARIVLQYLRVILLPSLSLSSPYHDDFLVSRGLFDPPTTLLSILAIFGLVTTAIARRHNWPLFAFAVLWFFGGHLLESTVLPLELYFEHRNYLPMLGFYLAIAYWVASLTSDKHRRLGYLGIALYTLLAATISLSSAQVWGRADLIAQVWSAERPASLRAQLDAIDYWTRKGVSQQVNAHFEAVLAHHPNNAGIYLLQYIIKQCNDPSAPLNAPSLERIKEIIPRADFDHMSITALRWIKKQRDKRDCRISWADMSTVTQLYLENPKFNKIRSARAAFYLALADFMAQQRDGDGILQALDGAYESRPNFDTALQQAWWLAIAKRFEEAEEYLVKARETPRRNLGELLWRKEKIQEMEEIIASLRAQADSRSHESPTP
jgi:hypothetical protein